MEREAVRRFFDAAAPGWARHCCTDTEFLNKMLEVADITPGCRVLDVACGTGVLFGPLLEHGAAELTGLDLSPAMLREAARLYPDKRIRLVCGDALTEASGSYDRIVVFNALPHFEDPAALLRALAACLAPGGRLTVAHSRGRQALNALHAAGSARGISVDLLPAAALAELLPPGLAADRVCDEPDRYWVSAVSAG